MEREEERAFVKRFFEYKLRIAGRTYCYIEELARYTGREKEFVCRDLHEMIRQGYFKEGYLVSEETILILDKEVYRQHLAGKKTRWRKRNNG